MKRPALNKKQIILLASLAALLVVALIVVIAVASRPAAEVIVYDDAPEETGETVAFDDTVDDVQLSERRADLPDPVLQFVPDPEHPMPEDGALLALGAPYEIGGTILANYPIETVTVTVTCAHNNKKFYPYKQSVTMKHGASGASYDLRSDVTDQGKSLAALLEFESFAVGVHTLRITAACSGTRAVEVFRCTFYVAGEEWEQITKENFPDSYPEALKFFGSTEKFLYRYQWVSGRYIMADPEWEKTYITEIPGYPNGEPWRMHVDAVSYMQNAFDYLETSYVRVHGTNGDTGVIKAISLITEYNGCYVSRFTSSLKSISHHTFGTAVDVNASMEPNKNVAENTAVIDDDVKGHLVYNGILEENGVPYYDFTYDGAYPNDPNGVPETCVNYLLYELGFFRAGFLWAHYYRSTSDAMHFCLSEFVTYNHEHPQYGLRKVYEYAPRVATKGEATEAPTEAPTGTPDAEPAASPSGLSEAEAMRKFPK